MNQFYVLGIGHRAQQGKDSIAKFIIKHRKNTYILHWADPLKEELMNKERKYPLVIQTINRNKFRYFLLNDAELGTYNIYNASEVPKLYDIFQQRCITEYMGMDGNGSDEHKDGDMLQFWGTDYKRNMVSITYWTDIINRQIKDIQLDHFRVLIGGDIKYDSNVYVLIPDTRMINEVECVNVEWNYGSNVGYFIDVTKINEDGEKYYSPDRDRNHPTECSLDNYPADFYILNDGTLDKLECKVIDLLHKIETKQK